MNPGKNFILPTSTRSALAPKEIAWDQYLNLIRHDGNRVRTDPRQGMSTGGIKTASNGSFNQYGFFSGSASTHGTVTGVVPSAAPSVTEANLANTTASAGQAGGLFSNTTLYLNGNQAPLTEQNFKLVDVTGVRMFIGLVDSIANSSMVGNDDPANAYIGLQFSTDRGDTNFQFVYRPSAGGTQTKIDTGVVPSVLDTDFYSLEMDHDGASTILVFLYKNGIIVWSATLTTNLIPLTSGLSHRWMVESRAAANKNLRHWGDSRFMQRLIY